MSRFLLNLSTRPFLNYRLANLALTGILASLTLLSVWQVSGFLRFSSLSSELAREEQDARVEWEELGQRLSVLESRMNRPESAARLEEIQFLNGLIARKSFSWTQIFQDLENIVPPDVHLISLQPAISENGSVLLRFDVRGRTISDVSLLIESLQASPLFENVVVSLEDKQQGSGTPGVEVKLTANYHPRRAAAARGAP